MAHGLHQAAAMRLRRTIWVLSIACGCSAVPRDEPGSGTCAGKCDIWGESDDRHDVWQVESTPSVAKEARAVAALFRNPPAMNTDGSYGWTDLGAFGKEYGLCPEERFVDQPTFAAGCAAFWLGKDLLVTAGHCMAGEAETPEESLAVAKAFCRDYVYAAFDLGYWQQPDNPAAALASLDAGSIYKCVDVVYLRYETVDLGQYIEHVEKRRYLHDVAILRLDRKVTERSPLQFRSSGTPAAGDRLRGYGFPFQLPLKVSTNGFAKDRLWTGNQLRGRNGFVPADEFDAPQIQISPTYFAHDVDTQPGYSGGPIVNDVGVVEGIISIESGESRYYRYPERDCSRFRHCPADNPCTAYNGAYAISSVADTLSELLR